jgi:putative ABC transport system ATP-binding protein/lipoprotein-releasing system ATP-binding protein
MDETTTIKLENIHKTYALSHEHRVTAVNGVSLEVACDEFVVITGRSGSGKTTLLNLIAGLTRPTSGKVFLDGLDLWLLPDSKQSALRNRKIGFVFQFPSLLPSLTVLENVALPSLFNRNGTQAEAVEKAAGLLDRVGLREKLMVYPRQLSAGQQQRVVVARALFNQPELLLADEPTSDLDEQTEIEIMELFHQIHRESGITIVMVTHSSQLVSYGTRAIQMVMGKIVENSSSR